MTVLLPNAV